MKFLRLAKEELRKSDHIFAHHGVVVMKGGKPVAVGHNHGWTHAEVNALEKLWPSERRGCKLISIRMTKTGKLTTAKPCGHCEAYLRKHGIKKVYYTDVNSEFQEMRIKA